MQRRRCSGGGELRIALARPNSGMPNWLRRVPADMPHVASWLPVFLGQQPVSTFAMQSMRLPVSKRLASTQRSLRFHADPIGLFVVAAGLPIAAAGRGVCRVESAVETCCESSLETPPPPFVYRASKRCKPNEVTHLPSNAATAYAARWNSLELVAGRFGPFAASTGQ
eukprot:264750-Chlamydomonas_euryale.AAC.8